ncbi:hypothetical protein ACFYZJ_17735 [Streptomyces sp. NPDC001848]|uniref:hypothetical protein n=1 Tax=Streptomyces sp. NPDC001848 TaxID=3364618 RepID=UPI0036C40BB3
MSAHPDNQIGDIAPPVIGPARCRSWVAGRSAAIVGGLDDPTAWVDLQPARHRVLHLHRAVVERLGEELLVGGVDEIRTAPQSATISPTSIESGSTARSASTSTAYRTSSAAASAARP